MCKRYYIMRINLDKTEEVFLIHNYYNEEFFKEDLELVAKLNKANAGLANYYIKIEE